ncbi:MAG TPA: energy transducer TonB [Allosphingosinicella sp.]|jgi:TonB family protein
MLPLALLAAAAQQAPALGSEVTIRGRTFMPQLWFDIELRYQAVPGLYRRAEHNWRARRLQIGPYPAEAFAARREGTVYVRLVVDAAGRLTGCTVMQPSGAASLDRHACPHLMRYAVFHPALDDRGRRVPQTFGARLDYQLIPRMHAPLFSPGDGSTPARPLQSIDAATVGIDASTRRPPNVNRIDAALAVGADGAVTACTLTQPSLDDAIDRRFCDGARAVRFEPARDAQGRNVAGDYHFGLPWPDGNR